MGRKRGIPLTEWAVPQILLLRQTHGLTYQEIGERFNVTESWARRMYLSVAATS